MSDEYEDDDEAEVLEIFNSIISDIEDDLDEDADFEPTLDVDASTVAVLMDGTRMRFSGIDAGQLAKHLMQYAAVSMHDEDGKTAVVFLHGISALIGTKGKP